MAVQKIPGGCVDCGRPVKTIQCVACYRKRLGRDTPQRRGPLAESMNYPPRPQYQQPQVIHHYAPLPSYQTHVPRSVAAPTAVPVVQQTTQLQESLDGLTWRPIDRVNDATQTQVRLKQLNQDGSETILQVRGVAAPAVVQAQIPMSAPVVEAVYQPTTVSVMQAEESDDALERRFARIELD